MLGDYLNDKIERVIKQISVGDHDRDVTKLILTTSELNPSETIYVVGASAEAAQYIAAARRAHGVSVVAVNRWRTRHPASIVAAATTTRRMRDHHLQCLYLPVSR